jgi:predicted PhzF superfamily epimerase YddE/YHI9
LSFEEGGFGRPSSFSGVVGARVRAMSEGIDVDVLRVFCDAQEGHGNPLGVVLDGAAIPEAAERQELAFELGFSETVYVDDAASGALAIYTPAQELPLAGHPLVGTAWLLARRGMPVAELRPPAGTVACGASEHGAWIEADPASSPHWELRQLPASADVDALDAEQFGSDAHAYVWAWEDQAAGSVRARAFASGKGIAEDEATGSAALVLGGQLGCILSIAQGAGSRIQVIPGAAGLVRVGGRVVADHRLRVRD